MRHHAMTFLAAAVLASPASAQSYTNSGAFFGAAGTPAYTETFETVPIPKNTMVTSFSQAGITYTGLAGSPFPNLVVAAPGYTNFGSGLNPTTTSILAANGDEDILIQFLSPFYAVGFDVYYNGLGNATASFFNGSTLLSSISYNGAAVLGFNGYIAAASTPVTSVRFVSTLGGQLNTGLDNVAVYDAPISTVPEPAILPLLATGLAALALIRRRRA